MMLYLKKRKYRKIKMSKSNILEWISNWYLQNCDGNWEHDFGIIIETLDNPGWSIIIDTVGTSVKLEDKPWILQEKSPKDWYGYKILNGKFEASGDPTKLQFLLNVFQKMLSIQSKENNNK